MDDAEFDLIKARIEGYARILIQHGVRRFDPGELGSPFELSPETIARIIKRLDDEERAFIKREIEPLKLNPQRIRCDACRKEMFGLCDECSAAFLRARGNAGLPASWERAEDELASIEAAGPMTVVYPCEKGHGPGSPRWVEVFSCELGQTVGRCECQDKTLTIPPRPSRAALESAWAEDERQWHQHQDAWSMFPPRFEDIGDGQRADVNSGARLRMLRRKGSSNGGQESGARVISLDEGRRRHRDQGGSQT